MGLGFKKHFKSVMNRNFVEDVLLLWPSFFLRGKSRYTKMQKLFYDRNASKSIYDRKDKIDLIVWGYDLHNKWEDYDAYLMKYIDGSYKHKIALDFGCGPGRNIIKYHEKFLRIDGADISLVNIKNAKKNLQYVGIDMPNLYVTSGCDCGDINEYTYDFVFSTITMQHICVYEIRFQILQAMFRALKDSGRLSIQMGFGNREGMSVDYYANYYSVLGTNSKCDTRVESSEQVKNDLEKIGFKEFEYWLRPTGPGDKHSQWIFFTAVK